jgi:uncharacterized membrane protein
VNHEVTITIDAPVPVVWSVLADVERWPEWTESVRSVELLDGSLAVGNRVRIRQPKFPSVVWRVTDVDPGTSFTWRSKSPGADAYGTHTVIDNGDGTSSAVLAIAQTGPIGTLVALLSRRLTKRYVEFEAQGLKRRSEQRAAEVR